MIKYLNDLKNNFFLLAFQFFFSLFVADKYKDVLLYFFLNLKLFKISEFFFNDITELFNVQSELSFHLCYHFSLLYFIYLIYSFLNRSLFYKEYYFLFFFISLNLIFWVFLCVAFYNCFIPSIIYFFQEVSWRQGQAPSHSILNKIMIIG